MNFLFHGNTEDLVVVADEVVDPDCCALCNELIPKGEEVYEFRSPEKYHDYCIIRQKIKWIEEDIEMSQRWKKEYEDELIKLLLKKKKEKSHTAEPARHTTPPCAIGLTN